MASKGSSATLRDLRMSTAMSSMTLNRTRSILAPSSSSTSVSRKRVRKDNKIQEQQEKKENSQNSRFSTAPQKTLNLVTPNTKRDWLKKAEEIIKAKPKETKKVRKKRLWLQAKEKGGLKAKNGSKQRYIGDWAFLPDIVLEIIFQYLPFEQKTNCAGVCPNWARIMAFSSVRFFFQNFEWSRRGSSEARTESV